MGRHKVPDNEKQLFQRVGLRYETYKRLKQIVEDTNAGSPKVTISDVIEAALNKLENN